MSKQLNILKFNSYLQLNIFFLLINNPKGLERKEICKRLDIKWTTAYDNIIKIFKRNYIAWYPLSIGVGHPKHIWFVPKWIKNKFLQIEFPILQVNNKILNK